MGSYTFTSTAAMPHIPRSPRQQLRDVLGHDIRPAILSQALLQRPAPCGHRGSCAKYCGVTYCARIVSPANMRPWMAALADAQLPASVNCANACMPYSSLRHGWSALQWWHSCMAPSQPCTRAAIRSHASLISRATVYHARSFVLLGMGSLHEQVSSLCFGKLACPPSSSTRSRTLQRREGASHASNLANLQRARAYSVKHAQHWMCRG